jgi:rifampin ADP-ribosylating transferase
VAEITDWVRLSPEALQTWHERLAAIQREGGEIIN